MFMWTGYFDISKHDGKRKKQKHRTTRSVPQLGRDKFQVVAALARDKEDAVSFQLKRKPGWYLRCGERLCFIEAMKKDATFENDASFLPLVSLWFPGYVAFESVALTAHYLRLKNGQLVMQHYDGTNDFKEEASFKYSSENDGMDMSYLLGGRSHSPSSSYTSTSTDDDDDEGECTQPRCDCHHPRFHTPVNSHIDNDGSISC